MTTDPTQLAQARGAERHVPYPGLAESDGIRHSWGLWGADDVFGCLNRLTADTVLAARDCVRRGAVFPLNWDIALPEPGLFERPSLRHELVHAAEAMPLNDVISDWNTQSSSQWDGFRHVTWAGHGQYNGLDRHGVHHWARRGIVGRAALADVARWRQETGRPLRYDMPDPITADDLRATLTWQGTRLRAGDILLIRVGWIAWYLAADAGTRQEISDRRRMVSPGLLAEEATAELLWDLELAAVAADNPSLELWPTRSDGMTRAADGSWAPVFQVSLHTRVLAGLGMPIGEMWDMEQLARDCAADGTYTGMLCASPLNLAGAAASPANVLVVK
jgi:kynurenine formamidase